MRMQTCSGLDSLRLVASSWTAIILWAGFFFLIMETSLNAKVSY